MSSIDDQQQPLHGFKRALVIRMVPQSETSLERRLLSMEFKSSSVRLAGPFRVVRTKAKPKAMDSRITECGRSRPLRISKITY